MAPSSLPTRTPALLAVTQVRSNWGRVFYTNLWSAVLLLFMTLAFEPQTLANVQWTTYQVRGREEGAEGPAHSYAALASPSQAAPQPFSASTCPLSPTAHRPLPARRR